LRTYNAQTLEQLAHVERKYFFLARGSGRGAAFLGRMWIEAFRRRLSPVWRKKRPGVR